MAAVFSISYAHRYYSLNKDNFDFIIGMEAPLGLAS